MENRRQKRISTLITALHTSDEKVLLLTNKRTKAKEDIRVAKVRLSKMQLKLDKASIKYQKKVKTFQLLDEILAEFQFSLKLKLEQEAKAAKQKTKAKQTKKVKTPEEVMNDIMACLSSLPEEKQNAIIKEMKEKQTGEINNAI